MGGLLTTKTTYRNCSSDSSLRFESEDSTDRQYDQIAKLKEEIRSGAQKPYVMSEREKQLYQQV